MALTKYGGIVHICCAYVTLHCGITCGPIFCGIALGAGWVAAVGGLEFVFHQTGDMLLLDRVL
eukprot:10414988-Ditylum_brightwellii.AAC.1